MADLSQAVLNLKVFLIFFGESEMHLLILRGEKKNHISLVEKHVSWYLCR